MSGTQSAVSDTTAPMGAIIVSVFVLVIFLAAIAIAWWSKDSSLQILLGMAGANAGTAVGYWLGSSSGSKAKDSVLAQAVNPPVPLSVLTTSMGTNK